MWLVFFFFHLSVPAGTCFGDVTRSPLEVKARTTANPYGMAGQALSRRKWKRFEFYFCPGLFYKHSRL